MSNARDPHPTREHRNLATSGGHAFSSEEAGRGALRRRARSRPSNGAATPAAGRTPLRRWSVADLLASALDGSRPAASPTDHEHAMSATRHRERAGGQQLDGQVQGSPKPESLRARLITLGLLAIGVLTLLLAVPGLREVLVEIRHSGAPWLILAIALELASCLSFVVIFRYFFDRLPPRLTRAVAWTEMGSGALLPGGGTGSLAIGGWLLHLAGMPTREIVRRSSGLFFLTSATNVAALIAGGLLLLTGISSSSHPLLLGGAPVLIALLGAGGTIALPALARHHTTWTEHRPWLAELIAGIREAEQALLRPSWRELGALGYLGFDIAVLWATLTAVGYHPQIGTLLLGYILGYLANLIPIPGGIGVLEGGVAATLIIYGGPPTEAVAGVLVYHAIAFWIPSLGGLWAYARIRRQITPPGTAEPKPAPTLNLRMRTEYRDEALVAAQREHPGESARSTAAREKQGRGTSAKSGLRMALL